MGTKLTTEKFVEKAKTIHGDTYDYSLVEYKTAKDKVKIVCPVHGEFLMSSNNHTHKTTPQKCPKCKAAKQTTEGFIDLLPQLF